MNIHEIGFLSFLESQQSRRVRALFDKGEKGRKKIIELLPHKIRLDPKQSQLLPANKQSFGAIYDLLMSLGAPKACYIISENSKIDGTKPPLVEGLKSIVGMGYGSFVSCKPGELGYFEFEGQNERFVLVRK